MRAPPLRSLLAVAALATLPAPSVASEPTHPAVHHDLRVRLDPEAHGIEAQDRVTFPRGIQGLAAAPEGGLRLLLHAGLALASEDPAWVVERVRERKADDATGESAGGPPLAEWRLRPARGPWPERAAPLLSWRGTIHHPPVAEAEEYARSFARTPGTIGPEGAVLTRATWWVPHFGEDLLSFRLAVDLPPGWDAVSQGSRTRHAVGEAGRRDVAWECPHPMEEVYLIASRFTVAERAAGGLTAMAYLRQPDPGLAAKYLDATVGYVAMYDQLIGRYPFEKFALVENFWETGYGMPSFTLLGPQVIRLPFILHSSYPHEILHNWWGNSVYVDWQTGNWCEGLTAYLADHLIREGQGRGAEYRLDTLKKYRSYVRANQDFPLREFRSRHSGATEAVGYGKSLLLFHMLRRSWGDATFRDVLRRFYADNLWRQASFADIAAAAKAVTGGDASPFLAAWVDRPGAPVLGYDAEVVEGRLRITLRQDQKEEPFPLEVPLAVTIEGRAEAHVVTIASAHREFTTEVALPGRALRLDLDPEFDVFRRLDAAEVPPTLGEVFGADRVTIVVPAEGKDPLAAAWRRVAEGWTGGGADVAVVPEDALADLPADRAVWVLGSANRWSRAVAAAVEPFGAACGPEAVEFGETRVPRAEHAFVFVARHPADEGLAIGWAGADLEAALPGLARKLPHYGKYSWLAFQGAEPTNVAKGTWPATASPLVKVLAMGPDGKVPARGALPARAPLARLAPVFDPERLLGHVRFLADDRLEGRGAGSPGLAEAAEYVAKAFAEAGLSPGGDGGTWFQAFAAEGGPGGRTLALRNVVGVLPGTHPTLSKEPVVVGAHLDHLGRGWPDVRAGAEGQVHNGADDNASGVAVLLELARVLGAEPRPRTIVFVAFDGEEWGLKGSRHFVATPSKWPAKDALAMVNLDTVGRLGAGKVQVLGTGTAREWPHIVMGVGYTTGVEGVSIPDDPQGSDQAAFAEAGVPAVQVFTGAHEDYHRPSDDVERVDAAGLAKVAAFVRETVEYLGQRPDRLSASGAPAPTRPAGEGGRKVLLGTVPDFAHAGPGVKVSGVVEGSPAAAAGLRAGDLLVALGDAPLDGLRAYSEALKRHAPGDRVRIRWKRDGEEMSAEVVLAAR